MSSDVFSVSAHYPGKGFDEDAITRFAQQSYEQLNKQVSLGIVYLSDELSEHTEEILDILRIHARIPTLVGATSNGLVHDGAELENDSGFTLSLHHFPETEVLVSYFSAEELNLDNGDTDLQIRTALAKHDANGWMLLADPFHLRADRWLESWNHSFSPVPIIGGLAMGPHGVAESMIFHNGNVYDNGLLAVGLKGRVGILPMVSQGCDPVGETWTITKANRNIIFEIGNRPAFEVLGETFSHLPEAMKGNAHGNIFAGMAISEYVDEYKRGDFLVRNLIGGDPSSGAIVVGALPRVGQTLQFQIRTSEAATLDLEQMLSKVKGEIKGRQLYGGSLFVCTGRGEKLFSEKNHDAHRIMSELGLPSLNGFFCSGEIGPVGGRSFLHGYTASLAIFADTKR